MNQRKRAVCFGGALLTVFLAGLDGFCGVTKSRAALDTTPPVITSFSVPSSSSSLTIGGIVLVATDKKGVKGYFLSEYSASPPAGAAGWSAVAPSTYTCSSAGEKILYAWAKDAAGNVSGAQSRSVTIQLTSAPEPSSSPTPVASAVPPAANAPFVSAVSGGFRNNSSVSVTGGRFGAKPIALPVVYDEFESGAITTRATVGSWSSTHGNVSSAAQLRHAFSRYAANQNFTADQYLGLTPVAAASPRWFVSLWVYLENDWDWGTSSYGGGSQLLSNIKFPARFWKGSGLPNIYNSFAQSLDYYSFNNVEFAGSGTNFQNKALTKTTFTKGRWHQFQQEFVDSPTGIGADCQWRLWWNGRKVFVRENFVCNNDLNHRYPLFVGFYNAWGPGAGETTTAPNNAYLDDVYVDNSLQRVEICDNPSHDLATHCEIQVPIAWADDSIGFTVKQGSFGNVNAWLFIFGADGLMSAPQTITFIP